MQLAIDVTAPFDLAQALTFLRRFTPCHGGCAIDDDGVTAALAVGGRAVPFRITAGAGPAQLAVEVADDLPAATRAVVARRARQFLSVDDDLAGFLAAAATDHPAFQAIVARLHGLHHVRFLTLEEITIYAVIMQRTPITLAARFWHRFQARFGLAAELHGRIAVATPAFAELVGLGVADVRQVVPDPRKAAVLPGVIRGVAALGEDFLRTAPYAAARDALLAIHGIGPFSAAAILLRGLGRMDELLIAGRGFAEPARALYGDAWDPRATLRRYGAHIGYWSYYLKTGVPRGPQASPREVAAPASWRRSSTAYKPHSSSTGTARRARSAIGGPAANRNG